MFYAGTVAPDHGGRRMLEQLAWLASADCDASLAPVVTVGDPQPELSPQLQQFGVRVLDPVFVDRRSAVSHHLPSIPGHCKNIAQVENIAHAADWVVVGNTPLAGSTEFVRSVREGGTVISWDGDSLSRWYGTYARWLRGRDRSRALRRRVSAVSAARFENRVMGKYDFLTVPGPADVSAVQRHSRRRKPILIVPNVVRFAQLPLDEQAGRSSVDALFVGSSYGPNIDGLRWLLSDVWPGVREHCPEATLTIVGRDLRRETIFSDSPAPDGVQFLGRVPDISGFYRSAKVVLVPLFYGSGVPNKVLEALATDSAVVMTPYVGESLGRPTGLRIHDGSSSWIGAIVTALGDHGLGRIDPAVREALLAEHGSSGFDRAMLSVVDRVRALRAN